MSEPQSRFRTNYLLLGANLALLLILLVTLGWVKNLRSEVTTAQGKVDLTVAQQRQACARGNLIRAAVNYGDSVQQSFLAQAASTREETAKHADDAGDPITAKINRDAAQAYRGLLKGFTPLPIIDCESIYP